MPARSGKPSPHLVFLPLTPKPSPCEDLRLLPAGFLVIPSVLVLSQVTTVHNLGQPASRLTAAHQAYPSNVTTGSGRQAHIWNLTSPPSPSSSSSSANTAISFIPASTIYPKYLSQPRLRTTLPIPLPLRAHLPANIHPQRWASLTTSISTPSASMAAKRAKPTSPTTTTSSAGYACPHHHQRPLPLPSQHPIPPHPPHLTA